MSASGASVAGTATSGLTESTAGQSSAGRGRSGRRGTHSGRGRNGSGGNRNNRSSSTSFRGSTPEMNGHVFECYEEQGDRRQYSKTLEALNGDVKKSCKFLQDMAPSLPPT
jgi:hypothetical protein